MSPAHRFHRFHDQSTNIFTELISGKDLKINYVKYDEVVRATHGFEIIGWPDDIPMQAPSTMGAGGTANQAKLLELLRAGTLYWQKVPEDELERLRKKYKKGRSKAKKAVEESEEEPESSEEEPQPKKVAKKPSKKQRAGEEERGGKASSGKGRKRKRDADDGEVVKKRKETEAEEEEDIDDEDPDPDVEPAPKKRSKGKGKQKVVETVEGAEKTKKGKESDGGKKRKRAVKAATEAESDNDAADEPAAKKKKAPFGKRRTAPPPGKSKSVVDSDDDRDDGEPTASQPGSLKPYVIPADVDMSLPANKTFFNRKVRDAELAMENQKRKELEAAILATRNIAVPIAGPSRPPRTPREIDDEEYKSSASSTASSADD